MSTISLAELLGEPGLAQQAPAPPRPLPEAQIMSLREIFANYRKARFEPGDLVAVSKLVATGNSAADHSPHIVLETRYGAESDFTQSHNVDPTCQLYGGRFDIRIACLLKSSYCAFWGESWYFEPYEAQSDPA